MDEIPYELLNVLRLNWRVYPVSKTAKHAMFKNAHNEATASKKIVREWIKKYGDCNWRVHPGKSGIFCLDIDRGGETHKNDGFSTMRKLVQKYGQLPDGPRLKTGGSGGCVVFFKYNGEDMRGGSNALGEGIDVSTIRGAVAPTIPPSIHQKTKNPYAWHKGKAPWLVPLPRIPKWIVQKLKPKEFIPPTQIIQHNKSCDFLINLYINDIVNAPAGASNRILNEKAFKVGLLVKDGRISYAEGMNILQNAARLRIKGEDKMSIIPTIKSGMRGGMGQ